MLCSLSWNDQGIKAAGVAAFSLFCVTSAIAEPVLDRVLSGVDIIPGKSCSVLRIGFNARVRYLGHFPSKLGRELRIRVRPIDRRTDKTISGLKREALGPPPDRFASVRAIEFETIRADGPTLVIRFERSVFYQVSQGTDFESIIVAVSGARPSRKCKAIFPSRRIGGPWRTEIVQTRDGAGKGRRKNISLPRNRRPERRTTQADLRSAGASMDEARAALKRKKNAEAIRLLSKVLRLPENEYSAEAQELLGLAYQRDGQLARARAEYRDLLARYPTGQDKARVAQRLAAVEPRDTKAKTKRKEYREARPRARRGRRGWSVTGSASQFYVLDDSYRKLRDPSLPPDFNRDEDDNQVYQNALISSLYVKADWESDSLKANFQFSGVQEHSFQDDKNEIVGISSLYAGLTFKELNVETRIGRQTRNTGGVLGRFDGAVVNWQVLPFARINAIAGSQVLSRRDAPFKDDSYFYGLSVDLGPFWGGLDTTFFAIEQRTEGFVDRRAVGFEGRYFDTDKSLFVTTDFDVYYNELNLAIVNGFWTLPDKSTFTAAVDYRTSPYLLTYNALQGQFVGSLDELSRTFSRKEIEQLARDRTATAKSASIGYTRPLSNNWQIGIDATVANISGTRASGNVPGSVSTGNEYYYAAQLIGNDLFGKGDTSIFGLRYVDRELTDTYVLDLNTRYLLSKDLQFNPRLRFTYQESDSLDLMEYAILPSVVFNYSVSKDWSIELELGTKWSERKQTTSVEEETELFFTLGYRYDFYAEGRKR